MTGAVLIAIYLLALALFLGLDIVARVPPTLYAVVLAGLGALAGVALLAGLRLGAVPTGGTPVLAQLATALGAAAAVGGALAAGRSVGTMARKAVKPRPHSRPVAASPAPAVPAETS
jgi:NAD(P) transhydrogenase subunit alpha